MTRRLAFRRTDVERAIRAAQATGAGAVVIRRDGSIAIEATPPDDRNGMTGPTIPSKPKEIVLC